MHVQLPVGFYFRVHRSSHSSLLGAINKTINNNNLGPRAVHHIKGPLWAPGQLWRLRLTGRVCPCQSARHASLAGTRHSRIKCATCATHKPCASTTLGSLCTAARQRKPIRNRSAGPVAALGKKKTAHMDAAALTACRHRQDVCKPAKDKDLLGLYPPGNQQKNSQNVTAAKAGSDSQPQRLRRV